MNMSRRFFITLTGAAGIAWEHVLAGAPENSPNYKVTDHWWAMLIDVDKCIGCGNCVRACSVENHVPAPAREEFIARHDGQAWLRPAPEA
jgi:ferredoxin